jgi:uncharacterized protein YhdP
MQIRPEETELLGQWESIGTTIRADTVAARIKKLIDTHLAKVAVTESGWETLYRDPTDLRLWELTARGASLDSGNEKDYGMHRDDS